MPLFTIGDASAGENRYEEICGAQTASKRTPGATANPKWNLRRIGALQVLEAPALARLNWLVHGFSTRPGGASELIITRGGQDICEKVLNLGFTDWDESERVRDNREKFFRGNWCGQNARGRAAADSL